MIEKLKNIFNEQEYIEFKQELKELVLNQIKLDLEDSGEYYICSDDLEELKNEVISELKKEIILKVKETKLVDKVIKNIIKPEKKLKE